MLAAKPEYTNCSTFKPQRSTALIMFLAISLWQVIRCTLTSMRTPDKPSGFLMPS
ncbi:Uncharacterised protein [Vibrio cholerae]|nr:Uncharacterised protein [Vibrio cholerae]